MKQKTKSYKKKPFTPSIIMVNTKQNLLEWSGWDYPRTGSNGGLSFLEPSGNNNQAMSWLISCSDYHVLKDRLENPTFRASGTILNIHIQHKVSTHKFVIKHCLSTTPMDANLHLCFETTDSVKVKHDMQKQLYCKFHEWGSGQ